MTTENKITFTDEQLQWIAQMGSDMYIKGVSETIENLQKTFNQMLASLPANKQRVMEQLIGAFKSMSFPSPVPPQDNTDGEIA